MKALALSPDGASLASAWGDGRIRILDFASGRVRWTGEVGTSRSDTLAFSPDGKTLASLAAPMSGRHFDEVLPSRIIVRDAETGKVLVEVEPPPRAYLSGGVAWSRDGKVLAAGGGQQVLRWSVPDWKPLPPLSTWCSDDGLKACIVEEVAFSPDGKTLLVGAFRSGDLRWNTAIDEKQTEPRTAEMVRANPGDGGLLDLAAVLTGPRGWALWSTLRLTSAAFQPGGSIIALGAKDRMVKLRDGTAEQSLGELEGHADEVSTVLWTQDGRVLISGGDDGEIRFWSPQGRPLAVLRVVEGTASSYVFTEGSDARIEVFGAEAARFPVCRAGQETLPFEACAERFGVKGLLAAALGGDRVTR